MKLGVLFSGGKDSVLAMDRAARFHHISCLITIVSTNLDSYMFHTPCIQLAEKQAEALEIPHVVVRTAGEKEEELLDLDRALSEAVTEYGVDGVVTGAIASVYQASRIQRLCYNRGLRCFNPLWLERQERVLEELLQLGYRAMIVGVSAYPLEESHLGRIIDARLVDELVGLKRDVGFNPAGEGGEIETFVLDGPLFKKRLHPVVHSVNYSNYSGRVDMDVEVCL